MLTTFLGYLFAAILGLGWGSYATMATYRFPRGETWGGKKPRCPSCGHELKFKDFAPIWAFVVNRGKCKFCGVPVTPVYLCTELYCLLVFLLSFAVFGFSEQFLLVSTIGVFITILTITELESRVIPDKALLLLLLVGSVYRTFMDHSIYGLFYGAAAGLFLGIGIKHYHTWRQGKAFDWHQAFLRIFKEEYTYVRLLAVLGVLLPLPHFIGMVLATWLLMTGWKALWHRFSISLPLPYGGTMGALTLGLLLFAV